MCSSSHGPSILLFEQNIGHWTEHDRRSDGNQITSPIQKLKSAHAGTTVVDGVLADKNVAFGREGREFEPSDRQSTFLLGSPLLVSTRFLKNRLHCYFINKGSEKIKTKLNVCLHIAQIGQMSQCAPSCPTKTYSLVSWTLLFPG